MKTIFLTLSATFFCISMFAQSSDFNIDFTSGKTGLPLQVSLTKPLSEQRFNTWIAKQFFASDELSLQELRSEQDEMGWKHTRLQQYYKGYLIEGSMIIAHSKQGEVQRFNGDWFKNIQPQNAITLSEQEALAAALKKVNAQSYKWENVAAQEHMRMALNQPDFSYAPKGQLVLLPDRDTQNPGYHFAWKFNIYAEKPLYRAYVYVDAGNGVVLRERNLICHADVPGTATTKYSGTHTITTDSYAGGYRLRETGRGNGIETYSRATNSTTATDFSNATTTWSLTNNDQGALDAHWGTEKSYDYFRSKYNRNSIDNNGFKLLSYVHADLVAMGLPDNANAFWDGECMTYGDGDAGSGFTIMTALDICGHEITHGLVQHTAMLEGFEGDALNEAFADIFGTAIEWYARPLQHDWIMGKEITTNGSGVRNISDPNADGHADTYGGTNWITGDGGMYHNNGPCVLWFYLLSVGGSGVNDNGNSYNVSSITMAKAEAIAYRALTVYMTPGTDYAAARVYTTLAAKDLYGACSNEEIQTINAWRAVGVGNAYSTQASVPAFSSNDLITCAAPAFVNFTNSSTGNATALWRFGDGTTSTDYHPVHTYTANGTYNVRLIMTNCNGSKDSLTKTAYIKVDPSVPCTYTMPVQTTTYTSCNGTLYDDGGPNSTYGINVYRSVVISTAPGTQINLQFDVFGMGSFSDGVTVYKGTTKQVLFATYNGTLVPQGGAAIATGTNVIRIEQHSDGMGGVNDPPNLPGFKLNWTCTPSSVTTSIHEAGEAEAFHLYPNPVSSQLTLSFPGSGIKTLHIYDAQGRLVRTGILETETSQIDVTALSPGLYMLQVSDNAGFRAVRRFVKQ